MIQYLLDRDYEVTVLDNFLFGEASLNHYCHNPNFFVINGDVRDKSLVESCVKSADIIIPLAALVGAPLCAPKIRLVLKQLIEESVLTLLDLVSPNQTILMPTTNSAYGTGDKNNYCDENSPLRPISNYAIEKVEVEKRLMDRENSVSFRLATVFGMSPRMRIDLLVNDFVYRAVKDKAVVLFESHFKRNYIHVRDVSRAFIHGIDNIKTMRGEIYNVGLSSANVSKKELCEAIQRHVKGFTFVEAKIGKDPDQRNYLVSNSKIEATGFQPAFDLDFGIKELVKGFEMIRNTRYGNV